MNFSLNDEQTLLKESIEQYLQKSYTFDERMGVVKSDQGFSSGHWQEFAELGWLALLFEEQYDGFGGGAVETMLLMQEFGKHLVIEPVLATVVMAGSCLSQCENNELKAKLLPEIMDGTVQLAFGFAEKGSGNSLERIKTKARVVDNGYELSGDKAVVLNGPDADYLFITAVCEQKGAPAIEVFCVPARSRGVKMQNYKTVDGQSAANIQLQKVAVGKDALLKYSPGGLALARLCVNKAMLAVCCEAVGIMEALTYKTIDYTKERQQFGVPISSFQALQHRMVDMFMRLEQGRSLLLQAVIQSDQNDARQSVSLSALKYYIGSEGRHLGEEAVQLHGGMGVTEEMDVAHLFMRLTAIDTWFGSADYHLGQYIEQTDQP